MMCTSAVGRRVVDVNEPNCGGCVGKGAHSRRCRTQPGWFWERLRAQAESLGDMIGSNDAEASNMAYAIAGRMKVKSLEVRSRLDEEEWDDMDEIDQYVQRC